MRGDAMVLCTMKAVLLLVAIVGLALATPLHTKTPRKLADGDFLVRQKQILKLLLGVGHDNHHGEHGDYDIAANTDHYSDPKVVKDFLYQYRHGFLDKDATFSLNCKRTRYQTIKLFDLFFFAKDFETFFKTACWARHHLNGAQFTYAFYVAVYHRPDCHAYELPPLYEVFPHLFVPSDLMHKVFDAKMEGETELKLYMNNSGWEMPWHRRMFNGVMLGSWDSLEQNIEDRMSYFREDVGLNEHVAEFLALYPSWLSEEKYNVHYFRRGETYYYFIQQLFARYALERNANEMPNTEMLGWYRHIKDGYNPKLSTMDGHALFPRADNMMPFEYNPKMVLRAEEIESRVSGAIDFGRFFVDKTDGWTHLNNTDGIDAIGKTVFGTPDSASPHYYGAYFWKALSAIGYMIKTSTDHELVPGAMGGITTMARDPAFYMYLHRLLKLFQHHKKYLHFYTNKDLIFPGVKIESFEVDKLVTFFDRFDFEVTNGVPIGHEEKKNYKDYHYVVKQFRLNHKPFTYKLTVSSDKSADAMIRVFIGPSHDANGRDYSLDQARMAYVEIDRFSVKLNNGQNVYERSSKESPAFVEDHESFRSYMGRIMEAIEKKEPFYVSDSHRCGLPERLILPKGWKSGQPFTIFAIVSPFEEKHTPEPEERHFDSYITCGDSHHYDHRAYGFPFDRMIPYDDEFHTPNMLFKDVLIYHKDEADVNRVA